MVFSAPEITTVSKPNKNPAKAAVSDQKKIRGLIISPVSVPRAPRRKINLESSYPIQARPRYCPGVFRSPGQHLGFSSPQVRTGPPKSKPVRIKVDAGIHFGPDSTIVMAS